ncbi:hypothetical protein Wildcat_169 [Mycobacterium phage Wildcat]|uniref:Uncharacterized protein n=3 Tax=Mycobacterium virus Wildcat TaxID=1993859 RepID=Q19XR5_9CAUD|nr:hypothetical protein Wildcat_169 [Mycobacterium phage Wildcat]ABE67749.1 hypothetical protein Wildcat_169 [Mycobacterium phage Wildcat]AJD82217.1 hypothetical protein COSMO_170 [Mycobacterium phage Cosmo]QGJ90026.1 hypothetical protein PBI_MARYV_155 [Mycobacterium phage MaryV]WKR36150.1 hypothetical protein [Mycobacterium phage Azrael100]
MINASQAYRKGWDASKRTTTYDLGAAETRFEERHGSTQVNAFIAGWTDYASDQEYGHSFS